MWCSRSRSIIGVAKEMKASSTGWRSNRKIRSRSLYVLQSGDGDDRERRKILEGLDRVKGELVLRIWVAQVGLVGACRMDFADNLAHMDRLRDRALRRTGACRLGRRREVRVNGSRSIGHESARCVRRGRNVPHTTISHWVRRVLWPTMLVWSIGRGRRGGRRWWRGDGRIMTQGGEAATRCSENFWG